MSLSIEGGNPKPNIRPFMMDATDYELTKFQAAEDAEYTKLVATLPDSESPNPGYISRPGDLHPEIDPEPKGYLEKTPEHELAKRRKARVGRLDGVAVIGGATRREVLIKIGVRSRVSNHSKDKGRGSFSIDKEVTIPSKLRTRQPWQMTVQQRAFDRASRQAAIEMSQENENRTNGENKDSLNGQPTLTRVERFAPPITFRRSSHPIAVAARR